MTPTFPKTKAPFVCTNDVYDIFAVYICITPPFIALMVFSFLISLLSKSCGNISCPPGERQFPTQRATNTSNLHLHRSEFVINDILIKIWEKYAKAKKEKKKKILKVERWGGESPDFQKKN
jgi:hypothetical protein